MGDRRRAGKADRLARSVLQALGLGAIRPHHPRQHRAAAGRRRRGGAGRGRAEGPRAHHRRDAALLRGRSVRGRQAGGGRMLAQSHRGRRQAARASPTISISAIRSGRRSWASSSAASAASREACKALDFPVVSGNVSLYNETNGRAILPTPSIGGVGLLDDFTKSATLAFKARRRGDPAGRRDHRLARPVDLSARDLRPRGGRAAAGRSDRGARERRFRPRADPRRHGDRRARSLRRRAGGGARRNGDGLRHRRDARRARPTISPAHAYWFGEDQARYLVTVPAAQGRRRCSRRARAASVPVCGNRDNRRRRIDACRRAPHPGHELCASVSRAGCRPIWRASCRRLER